MAGEKRKHSFLPSFLEIHGRPDAVYRVFSLKVKAFIDVINSGTIFGLIISYIYSIEFQKRGLLHMPLLITCEPNLISSPADIDRFVSAELPSEDDGLLYDIITRFNLH